MNARISADERATFLEIIEQQQRTIAKQRREIVVLHSEIASLRSEIASLRQALQAQDNPPGAGSQPAAAVPEFVKPNRPRRDPSHPRKKRAKGYARKRMTPTRQVKHAVEVCDCGCRLQGDTVKRTRQVLHIPLVPVEVIEHVFIQRRCPRCGKRHVPKAREALQGVVLGQQRLSSSTMALIAALREVGRMPLQTIAWQLRTFHQLSLSVGEIVYVLASVAKRGRGSVEELLGELRQSPVVHGDETTWREEGRNGYFWVFSTPQLRYFEHRCSRSGEIVEQVLGEDFEGTLVSDFYSAYGRMKGQHQRCWAHLLRDVHELREKWPEHAGLEAWAQQVQSIYERAKQYSQTHVGATLAVRLEAKRAYERELLALAQPYLQSDEPQQTLCRRIESYLSELFTFVADPRVPADNNAAERAIRPFAISRKISGGTRSPQGSETKGTLATLFGTWLVRGLNPFEACCNLLSSP